MGLRITATPTRRWHRRPFRVEIERKSRFYVYNFSYVFVALTAVVSLVSAARPGDGGETRAGPTPLDGVSRWLFPIAYVAAVGISLAGWLSQGESWL
jgi:hypothetical protein